MASTAQRTIVIENTRASLQAELFHFEQGKTNSHFVMFCQQQFFLLHRKSTMCALCHGDHKHACTLAHEHVLCDGDVKNQLPCVCSPYSKGNYWTAPFHKVRVRCLRGGGRCPPCFNTRQLGRVCKTRASAVGGGGGGRRSHEKSSAARFAVVASAR